MYLANQFPHSRFKPDIKYKLLDIEKNKYDIKQKEISM